MRRELPRFIQNETPKAGAAFFDNLRKASKGRKLSRNSRKRAQSGESGIQDEYLSNIFASSLDSQLYSSLQISQSNSNSALSIAEGGVVQMLENDLFEAFD